MNNPHDFWPELLHAVEAGERCVLLCVVESVGSSPGRAGFKMFVTSDGRMHGSIGGGSMEHKLVELARSLMDQPERFPFLKRQVHQPGIGQDRSGMICSGEQTVAFYLFNTDHLDVLRSIAQAQEHEQVIYDHTGLRITAATSASPSQDEWYRERAVPQNRIIVVGGGHVGLALCRLMHQLGFRVYQYDYRDGLQTMTSNPWAHEKHVIDFARIDEYMADDPELFIALVSHGYRTDEMALRRLVRKRWRYLGMLGSAAKAEAMWAKLKADGFTDEELAQVHAPIGVAIHSRTPEEIAVSIAAEIIGVKNGSGPDRTADERDGRD